VKKPRLLWAATTIAVLLASGAAQAQMGPTVPPTRSEGWGTATDVMAGISLGLQAIMPRIFFSDPEVTQGWKARWHVSQLAPVMTLTTLALFNETSLKTLFKGNRPGCDDTNTTDPSCSSYGFLSTPSFVAGSALGQGAGVFLVDSLKWSNGQINAGALVGDVIVPLIIAPIVAVGRDAGDWETGGQSWGSAAIGLGIGLITGTIYAELQRPECGYTGNLICW
jgi:hypothetical protein